MYRLFRENTRFINGTHVKVNCILHRRMPGEIEAMLLSSRISHVWIVTWRRSSSWIGMPTPINCNREMLYTDWRNGTVKMMIDIWSIWRRSSEVRLFSIVVVCTIWSLASSLVIAASGVDDVRDVLDHYNQEPDPVQAFLLRQQRLLVSARVFCWCSVRHCSV